MDAPEINLDYVRARKFILPSYEHISLVLVGCGGTGSWLAPAVARVARILMTEQNKQVEVLFVDPDIVERANLSRQHFCDAEEGQFKADCLAARYAQAWGIPAAAIAAKFDGVEIADGLKIIIGCVDNAKARKSINALLASPYDRRFTNWRWWLDCGNSYGSGQVLIGTTPLNFADQLADAFALPEFATVAPAPALQEPKLLVALPEEDLPVDPNGCEVQALANIQGLAVNQMTATIAANYLTRLLITGDLRTYATMFDLDSGSMRSKYLVPGAFDRYLPAPKPDPKGKSNGSKGR